MGVRQLIDLTFLSPAGLSRRRGAYASVRLCILAQSGMAGYFEGRR